MRDATLLGAIAVREIGLDASAALAGIHAGRIGAVFARSVYVTTRSGWICLGPPELGSGPLNLLWALETAPHWRAGGLRPGAEVGIGETAIHLGPGLLLSLAGARIWRPGPTGAWNPATLRRGLAALDGLGRPRPPAGGLGSFLRDPSGPANGLEARRAAPAVAILRAWLDGLTSTDGDPPADVGTAAVGLLGFGSGLTPAGDDFLGGVLIALRRTGFERAGEALWRRLEPELERRTVAISAAHLRAAAAGRGAAALHAALEALLTGNIDALPGALLPIDRVGHSSGWDALTGVVTVLRGLAVRPAPDG